MSDFTSDVNTTSIADLTKRVRYSTGLVLGVDEFEQDQAYFIERDRLLTRALHGYGVVQGLGVRFDTSEDLEQVTVDPGMAVEPSGQHVCIDRPQCAVIKDWLARQEPAAVYSDEALAGGDSPALEPKKVCLSVVLRYGTCATDFVPITGEACRSAEDSQAASRLADDFSLALEFEAERPPQVEEHAVRLLGRALRAMEVRSSGPYISAGDLRSLVTAVPDVIASVDENSNVSVVTDVSLTALVEAAGIGDADGVVPPDEASDEFLFRVEPSSAAVALRAVEETWITDTRRELLEKGHDTKQDPLEAGGGANGRCQPVPKGDDGVVLGTFCLSVEPNENNGLQPAAEDHEVPVEDVQISTDDRPELLSTRLLQETGFLDSVGDGEGRELGPASGDLDGTYPELTVVRLQGESLEVDPDTSDVSLGEGSMLTYDGSRWHPDTLALNDLEDVSAETPRETDHLLGIDASEDPATWTAIAVSDLPSSDSNGVSALPDLTDVRDSLNPRAGNVLQFDGSEWNARAVPTNAETELTRIVATSWGHEDIYRAAASMDLTIDDESQTALAVAFGTEQLDLAGQQSLTLDGPGTVLARTLTQETFRVFMERKVPQLPVKQRERLMPRRILPLTEINLQGQHIVGGQSDLQAERARGAAFIFPEAGALERLRDRARADSETPIRVDVELWGSHILDEKERAVDAEFVRMDLPTGDRPRQSEAGVQGGRFESWIFLGVIEPVNLNDPELTIDRLMDLPGVGEAYAERILDYLSRNRPIEDPLVLTDVRGITEALINDEWTGRIEPPVQQ